MYKVDVYHRKTEGNNNVSANFKVSEFACNDGSQVVFINSALVKILQRIREAVGKPIVINSAYRTAAYNVSIGGATNSLHVYGCAADISCPGITVAALRRCVYDVMGKTGGIGTYKTFIHVDCRNAAARWDG